MTTLSHAFSGCPLWSRRLFCRRLVARVSASLRAPRIFIFHVLFSPSIKMPSRNQTIKISPRRWLRIKRGSPWRPVSAIKLVNRIRAQALDVILCMQLSELLITSIEAQTLFLLLRLVFTRKSSSWVEKFRHVFSIKSHAWGSLASMILIFICISSLN